MQQPLLLLVLGAVHPLVVRIALTPGVDDLAAGLTQQHGIVIVVVDDAVAGVGVDEAVAGSIESHLRKLSSPAYGRVTAQ